jgi:hypothetical protein
MQLHCGRPNDFSLVASGWYHSPVASHSHCRAKALTILNLKGGVGKTHTA